MSKDFDKEIDWLLRGHRKTMGRSRGRDASAPFFAVPQGDSMDAHQAREAHTSALHLDADELSAYAENALPEATRLRYTTHLADCDTCRQLATSITLAAGLSYEIEKSEMASGAHQTETFSWGAWFASWFAPRTLRWVAPVMAVFIIGVVALIVLRQPSPEMSVATLNRRNDDISHTTNSSANAPPILTETETTQTTTPASKVNSTERSSQDAGSPPDSKSPAANAEGREFKASVSETSVATTANSTRIAEQPPTAPPSPLPTASTGATTTAAPAPADELSQAQVRDEKTLDLSKLEDRPRFGSELRMEPSTTAKRDETERAGAGAGIEELPLQSRGVFGARDQAAPAGSQAKKKSEERDENKAGDSVAPSPPARGSATDNFSRNRQAAELRVNNEAAARRSRSESRQVARPMAEAERSEETRVVAGRRFRRQGNTWIDTAYRSGQAVTNVSRNSDQFRALVADEPEVRRIAAQLGGELIVVWKGRAYRIR